MLWFVQLLYPYMGFGFLCSLTAQTLATQAGNPYGAPLDVVDFPDLKTLHGLVGTILGTKKGIDWWEAAAAAATDCPYPAEPAFSLPSLLLSTPGFTISIRTNAAYDRYYEGMWPGGHG